MQPQQLRKRVRRWTLPIVALAVIGAIVAFAVSHSMPRIYQATGSILMVAGPPERRARMGAAGIEHVHRFAWPAVAKSFRAVYESIRANDSSPAVAGRSRAGGR